MVEQRLALSAPSGISSHSLLQFGLEYGVSLLASLTGLHLSSGRCLFALLSSSVPFETTLAAAAVLLGLCDLRCRERKAPKRGGRARERARSG